MKKTIFHFINMVVISSLLFIPPVHAKEKITVVTFEYPGFMQKVKMPGKGYGFGIDLITAALKEVNIEPVFEFEPMKRSLISLSHGKYVVMLGALNQYSTEDRKNLIGVLYGYGRFLFYYLKSKHGEIEYDKMSELRKYEIGSVIGSSSNRTLKKAGIQLQLVTKMEQNFAMLHLGRIDLAACIELTGNDIINKQYNSYKEDFVTVKQPFMILPLHVIFRKEKGKILADKFKAGFDTIKSNGIYMKIAKIYFGSDVPPEAIVEELR